MVYPGEGFDRPVSRKGGGVCFDFGAAERRTSGVRAVLYEILRDFTVGSVLAGELRE